MFLINAVPFKCPLITQSLCKCDCNLSQQSIYLINIQNTSGNFFFSSLCHGICEQSCAKKFVLLAQKYPCLKTQRWWVASFSQIERACYCSSSVNCSTNLSTMRHQQQMSPGSAALFPFPVHCLACFSLCYFLLFHPDFFFFFFILPLLLSLVPGYICKRNHLFLS